MQNNETKCKLFVNFLNIGYNHNMLNLIVAPFNQDRLAQTYAKRIVKYLKSVKVEYSTYFSQDENMVKENIEELLSIGESEFVVIGNDKIVSEFLNCVNDLSKIKLGIIPTSEFSDFATYLKLNTNPIKAIKDILTKHIEQFDVLIANDKRVINNIVIGASVEKNIKFDGLELTLDTKSSKAKTEKIYELVVANAGLNNKKPISPLANVQDGLFNLTFVTSSDEDSNKINLKNFKNGNYIYLQNVQQYWLNNLKITSKNKKIKALVDGEVCEFDSLNISIIENGLKIYKKRM